MRVLMLALCCSAAPAFSETYTVRSSPSSALVYLEGAKVSRGFTIEVPAGTHDIILPDLPSVVEHQPPQIEISNATLGAVSVRSSALPPLIDPDDDVIQTARELVKDKKAALAAHLDKEAGIRLVAEAAEAQIEFLQSLGHNEGLRADAVNLGDVANMVGEQTLKASQRILETKTSIRDLTDTREDLEQDVREAEDALSALLTADEGRVQMMFSVSTDVKVIADVTISYFANAFWRPLYDVALSKAEPASLLIRRGAEIAQQSGEDWNDVQLRLSTLQIASGLIPSDIRPRRLLFTDPPKQIARSQIAGDSIALAPPVVMEEAAFVGVDYDGPGVTYTIPNLVTVANEVDATRVAIDAVTFPAEIFARAVPFYDDTAFLMARFENTSAEPLFEVQDALYSVDNRFVGLERMSGIPAGAEGVLAFGPVEDLRLERDVLDRTEGDRGIISRSNERNEEIQISIRNLGSEVWDVELIDRVPYSEQEDLIVSFASTPEPDQEDFELQRGLLMWEFEMAPDEVKMIAIDQRIRWPDGKHLR